MTLLVALLLAQTTAPATVAPPSPAWGPKVTWKEGSAVRTAYVDPVLLAELAPTAEGERAVRAVDATATSRCSAAVCLWTVADARAAVSALPARHFAPVLHDGRSSQAAMRVAVGVVVLFSASSTPATRQAWLGSRGLTVEQWLGPATVRVQSAPGAEALALAARLADSDGVDLVVPDWWRPMQAK